MSRAPAKKPLRALIVEDSPDDMELMVLELRRAGFSVAPQRVETPESLTSALESPEWDIILTDHSMPHFSSTGVLNILQRTGSDIPCIIVSGSIGEEAAVAAMRSGAADYILKQNLARLAPAVEREVWEAEVRRKQRQAEDMVEHMAYHDPLTDLPNRRLFKERFNQAVARARRHRYKLAVMFLDVDRFKNINDSLGHSIGDQLLQELASRLSQCVREDDTVSRWGGDEFTFLFPDLEWMEEATRIAQKILDLVKQPLVIREHALFVNASIGIALYPNDGEDVETLLRNADTAMYGVKEHGGGHYQMYAHTMNASAMERLELETSLHYALDRNQLVLHYQPQIDVHTQQIIGMEALLRWNHPELGLIYPNQFISLAESNGLMIPIGQWVLQTACAQNKAWQDAGLRPIRMAVNFSVRQFQQRTLVDIVIETLRQTGLDPRFLDVEVTEGVALQPANSALAMLREFKAMGIHTSIDDFGTGYSSLGSLSRFAFDKLKIDKSFVHDITNSQEDAAIATMVIALAKSLNRKVLAEGVETPEQLDLLRTRGCDEIQGYLFSPAVPVEEATMLLQRQ